MSSPTPEDMLWRMSCWLDEAEFHISALSGQQYEDITASTKQLIEQLSLSIPRAQWADKLRPLCLRAVKVTAESTEAARKEQAGLIEAWLNGGVVAALEARCPPMPTPHWN